MDRSVLSLHWNSGIGKYHQTSPQKRRREHWQRHAWHSTEMRSTVERWFHRYDSHTSFPLPPPWSERKRKGVHCWREQGVHSWREGGCVGKRVSYFFIVMPKSASLWKGWSILINANNLRFLLEGKKNTHTISSHLWPESSPNEEVEFSTHLNVFFNQLQSVACNHKHVSYWQVIAQFMYRNVSKSQWKTLH